LFSLEHIRTALSAAAERLHGDAGERLHALCESLLDDVDSQNRTAPLGRPPRLRRADDRPQLRSGLVEVISRSHGDQVARDRLTLLDAALKCLARRGPPRPAGPWSARAT